MDDRFDFIAQVRPLAFKDILAERREQNDVSWITRSFHPKPAYSRQTGNCNPSTCRYRVLVDENIQVLIRNVLPNESASHHFQRINNIVNEIGYLKNILVVRWLGFVLIKIMKKVLQSIFITEVKLLKMKSVMGKNPVVFLPSHRSYADFILMAFLCFSYDIEIPIVVAGIDFYAMFGMAPLLRRCGAMYMRRSFKDDKIYGAVFKKYVQTVITTSDSPFEFFIEGTRSRCGKSLMPKLGLLKIVVEAFLSNAIDDVTFVPISINYDRLIEDVLFAREVIGIPKPKESTAGLLKGISLLEEQYGSIYINVGDEISLKDCSKKVNSGDLLPHLAHTIITRQQENTFITYFNMLSAVIICRIVSQKSDRLVISALIKDLAVFKNYLISFGACTYPCNDEEDVTRVLNVHKFLIRNTEDDVIYIQNVDQHDTVHKDFFKAAMSIILLQHYANPCYHFLVSPVILIMILRAGKQMDKGTLFLKYKLFRVILKHEFVFYESFTQQDFENACAGLCRLNLLQITDDRVQLVDESHSDYSWCNIMLPYLRGYLFICESLTQMAGKSFDKSGLEKRIRKQLELELEISGDVSLFYAFSSHFIACTFASLADADVLRVDRSTYSLRIADTEKLNVIINFLRFSSNEYHSADGVQVESAVCKL